MPEQQPTADTHNMTWVLNRLTQEKDVLNAVLLSSDGLALACSDGLDRDVVDRTSASVSSLFSLGRSLAEFAHAPEAEIPRKIILDLPDRCVLVFGAGHHTVLAVSISAEMTQPEVAVASAATIKAIRGLEPALSTRARAKTP
ncbi:roadblock/LC7 domain-containing protein [Streptomyces sp. NPDC085946]|uniref:roadblock/LC7 domain-containing protein n=1 Tax=Streptomyces sp. NPDC085946 TaxID=3365744 RepID=UPI0037D302F8